ncbi:MAG: glutamine synthetase type III, partial [Kiritimatiellae bacterium]|nr:glutamine synthetase type III [Kiritimatiellia bacterium]
ATDALSQYVTESTIGVMTRQGVLTERELRARYEIYLARYIHDIAVEARLTLEIGRTMIQPAVASAQSVLADAVIKMRELDLPAETSSLAEISRLAVVLQEELTALACAEREFDAHKGGKAEQACFMRGQIIPAMDRVREVADALEGLVDDALWPLPTYQEMLFIR